MVQLHRGYIITVREKETKKSCNVSCKNREVDKAVHQAIFHRKDDKWSIQVKGHYGCVNHLSAEDAVYNIQCGSTFQAGKANSRKSVMPRKCEKDAIVDKEISFLEIVEHIDSYSYKQFDISIPEKMMEEKLSGNNVLCLI